jgi:hypothetical protein
VGRPLLIDCHILVQPPSVFTQLVVKPRRSPLSIFSVLRPKLTSQRSAVWVPHDDSTMRPERVLEGQKEREILLVTVEVTKRIKDQRDIKRVPKR